MGGSRATAHLGETTLLDQVVENVRGSQVDEIVMVLGHQAETIKEQIAIQSLRVVTNESIGKEWELHCGLDRRLYLPERMPH
jgi:CTP:molybdopterin cytidylyltransferase MocA